MFLHLKELLTKEAALAIASALADAPFTDGKASAVGAAREAKHNEQLAESHPLSKKHAHTVFQALSTCEPFRAAAVPHTILPLRFCRYTGGMAYGNHLDAPMLSTANGPMRTDMSLTVWLSDAESYDGGELVMRRRDGTERVVKGDAGDAVLYSASTLHRVNPVTRGARIVAISWLQSAIQDDEQRDILFQLIQVASSISGKVPASDLSALHHLHHRLTRMWTQC